MTHADFLESLFSRLTKWAGESTMQVPAVSQADATLRTKAAVVARLERAPLFVLGSWDDIVASIMEFRGDLVEDLADGLMMPFQSIAVAFEGKGGWFLEWIRRLNGDHYQHTVFNQTQDSGWFRNSIEFDFRGKRDGGFWVDVEPETINRYSVRLASVPFQGSWSF